MPKCVTVRVPSGITVEFIGLSTGSVPFCDLPNVLAVFIIDCAFAQHLQERAVIIGWRDCLKSLDNVIDFGMSFVSVQACKRNLPVLGVNDPFRKGLFLEKRCQVVASVLVFVVEDFQVGLV